MGKTKADSKAKPNGVQLGLPFELEWTNSETDLKKVARGQRPRTFVGEWDRGLVEAMILEPGFREPSHGLMPTAHAAALLLRNPYAPAPIEDALVSSLDAPALQAVRPLLPPEGLERLTVIEVLAGRALDATTRQLITRQAVGCWAHRRYTLTLPSRTLTENATYAMVREVVAQYGDHDTFVAELRALWQNGLAKTLDFLEEELAQPFTVFSRRALANTRAAPAAFAHRHASALFATDDAREAAAFLEEVIGSGSSRDGNEEAARRTAVAYAVLVLHRAGEQLPDLRRRLEGRVVSPLIAYAAFAAGANVTKELSPWASLVAGRWEELGSRIVEAKDVWLNHDDLTTLVRAAGAKVSLDEAETLARSIRGTAAAADAVAFELFARLRDAKRLDESADWFDFEPRTRYPAHVEALCALRTCSPATQSATVERWLSTGRLLLAAADYDRERALAAAIRHGDLETASHLTGGLSRDQGLIDRTLLANIAACPKPEDLIQRIAWSISAETRAQLLAAVSRPQETALQHIARLTAQHGGPSYDLTIVTVEHELATKGLLEASAPARSRYGLFESANETTVLTIHFDDCPELRERFPGAASLTIFGKTGKPSRVPTRIVLHAAGSEEHRRLEAAPDEYPRRVVRVPVPLGFLGKMTGKRKAGLGSEPPALRPLLPAGTLLLPRYDGLSDAPLLRLADSPLVRGGHGDEGHLLVFANGESWCEYAGAGW
jgi:hypothetical protein